MRTSKNEKCSEILEEVDMILNRLPDKLDKLKKERRAEKFRIQIELYGFPGRNQKTLKFYEALNEIYNELGDLHKLAGNYERIGWYYYFAGDMEEALNNLNKSKEISENIEVSPYLKWVKTSSLLLHGVISSQRGDLIEALNYKKKALNLAKEYHFLVLTLWSLHNIGDTYLKLADWGKSILYHGKSLQMAENMQMVHAIVRNLEVLIEANLNKGDIKTAEFHLERIRKINNQESNKGINQSFRMCKALLLRKSKRTRDLGKAQEILKQISEEEVINVEITIYTMINLCEMLVLEFKESKDSDVLNELNPIINKLVKIAENQKSFLIMAETLLLKLKIATISLNLTKARQLLNQAQIIAEKYGLRNLAIKISIENDELIKNLAVFEKMKLENEPIEQRLDKINLEKQLNEMLHKNKFEIPEISDEDPVVIMVMTDSGLPLFTRVFKKEWNVNEQLFSGFLSAFNSFSDEIFKKGFDRAVFGDYSILMSSIDNFMIAYIFLGQSYLAKQRFSKFTEKIQNTETIQEKLIHSKNTGLVLYPKNIPELEAQINEIFVQKELII